MWERQGAYRIVARYIWLEQRILDPESKESQTASFWGQLKDLEDRLGLSPIAMMRLQWEIAGTTDESEPIEDDSDGNALVDDIRERAGG